MRAEYTPDTHLTIRSLAAAPSMSVTLSATTSAVFWSGKPEGQEEEVQQDRALDLTQATSTAGAGVLAISEEDYWRSDQPLWVVENQALFDRLDWLPPGSHGAVAYYAGQMPGRLLRWLARQPRASEVIMFPDYDGVGLLNYAKLLEACGSPTTFLADAQLATTFENVRQPCGLAKHAG